MFSEPISGSAPKFTIDSKLSLVERKLAEPLTLVCPAQGSPVPGYRSASNFSSSLVNTSPSQWKVHPPSCFEHSEANCQPACLLLPVSPLTLNFERKKSASLFASSRESHPVNQVFKQLCITEPVGGSAPKFSEKSSGFVLTEKSLHPFSLACPAQGSPTPAFRSLSFMALV